jgi:hypothetical protein
MKYLILTLLLFNTAIANLPPTSSKIDGDATKKTTFDFEFPNFTGTHVGSKVTISGASDLPVSGDITLTGTQFNDSRVGHELSYNKSTGVSGGAILAIDAVTSQWDLSDQKLSFSNNVITSNLPSMKDVDCVALDAQTVTNILTADTTYVLIDDACGITQQTTYPTAQEQRLKAFVGRINHPNRTTIQSVFSTPNYVINTNAQVYDFFDSLGPFNVSGNVVSPNGANLSINRASGVIFRRGLNYSVDDQDPHKKSFIAATAGQFFRYTRTTAGALFTTLDVSSYDLAGVITAMPGGGGTATNQRVFLLASGNMAVQYGQVIYTSLANAVAGVPNESFVPNQNLVESGVLIGVISCRKDATNASLVTSCVFSKVSRFDSSGVSVGSNSAATLQSSYDNSVTPQITTSTALGSLDIKRGSVADTDNVFRVQNGAGTTVAKISGDGYLNTTYSDSLNMLKNGGLELSHITDWTCTVGTCVRTTTAGQFTQGLAALKVTLAAQSMNVSQTITTPSGIMKQGFARFTYRIPATGVVTPTITITVDSTLQVTVPSDKLLMDGMFHQIEVPFIFGSTDVKVSYLTGVSTGDVFIDLTGVYQGLGLQNLQGDNVYSVKVSSTGVVSGENINWINGNCVAGGTNSAVYDCTFIAGVFSVAPNCTATGSYSPVNNGNVLVSSTPTVVTVQMIETGNFAARAFNLTCQKSGNDYLAASSQVYSQASANYGWRNESSTFTGISGFTPSANYCKHQRVGGQMEVSCSVAASSAPASLMSITVPDSKALDATAIVNTSTTAGPCQVVGKWKQNVASQSGSVLACTGTSSTVLYFGNYVASAGGLTPQLANMLTVSTATSIDFTIPISGWSNSPSITGSFAGVPAVPGYEGKVDTFSVSYGTTNLTTNCTGTPCFIDQVGSAVSSITRASTGTYSLNTTKTYNKLKCTGNAKSLAISFASIITTPCSSCSAISFITEDNAVTRDTVGTLTCQGSY